MGLKRGFDFIMKLEYDISSVVLDEDGSPLVIAEMQVGDKEKRSMRSGSTSRNKQLVNRKASHKANLRARRTKDISAFVNTIHHQSIQRRARIVSYSQYLQ